MPTTTIRCEENGLIVPKIVLPDAKVDSIRPCGGCPDGKCMYRAMDAARFRDGCSVETLGRDLNDVWDRKGGKPEIDIVLRNNLTRVAHNLIPAEVMRMRCRKNGQIVPILEKPGKAEIVLCECRKLVPDSDACLHEIMSKGSMMPAGDMLTAGNADNIRKLLGDDFKVTLLEKQPRKAIKTIVVPAHELTQGS